MPLSNACQVDRADVAIARATILAAHHDHRIEVVRVIYLAIFATITTSRLKHHLLIRVPRRRTIIWRMIIRRGCGTGLASEVFLDVEVGVIRHVLSTSLGRVARSVRIALHAHDLVHL